MKKINIENGILLGRIENRILMLKNLAFSFIDTFSKAHDATAYIC